MKNLTIKLIVLLATALCHITNNDPIVPTEPSITICSIFDEDVFTN